MLIIRFGPYEARVSYGRISSGARARSTYRTKGLSSQRLIGSLIDIERIGARRAAALIDRDVCFAKVVGTNGGAAVDNLHRDTVTDASDGGSAVAAGVSDGVTDTAIACRTSWTDITADGALTAALIGVDGSAAETAIDVWGDITSRGTVGSVVPGKGTTDGLTLGSVIVKGGNAEEGLAAGQETSGRGGGNGREEEGDSGAIHFEVGLVV